MTAAILKGRKVKTRVLRPHEYEAMRREVKSYEIQTNIDCCLMLGARYVECQRIQKHPEWFDGTFIHLQELKRERKQTERWIRLTPMARRLMPYFFRNKPLPTPQGMRQNMRLWASKAGLEVVGLSPKTLRKTWESWLVFYYPDRLLEIVLSQGHTETTALKHYLNLPFTEEDKRGMKEWVEGW